MCLAFCGRKVQVLREGAQDGDWVVRYACAPDVEAEISASVLAKWEAWDQYRTRMAKQRALESKRQVSMRESRSQATLIRELLAEQGIKVSAKAVEGGGERCVPELHLIARGPQATLLTELLFEALAGEDDGPSPLDMLEGQV